MVSMRSWMAFVAGVALAGAAQLRAQGAELIVLSDAGAPTAAAAFDVTPDGLWVVGTTDGQVFRWSESGGVELLSPPDWLHTSTAAVSDDGAVIVSTLLDPVANIVSPARWTEAGGWLYIGCLPGVPPTPDSPPDCGSGYDVSGDGSKVTGLAWHGDTYDAEAFLFWMPGPGGGGGMIGLGLPTPSSSRGSTISADGRVVGGFYEHPDWGMRRPVRWTDAGAPDLFVDATTLGEVGGVSTDGALLTGQALLLDDAGFPEPPWTVAKAFRFSDAAGFRYVLPIRDYDDFGEEQGAMGNGVSDAGAVVGWSGSMGPWGQVFSAFACPASPRMKDFTQLLVDEGATVPADIALLSALDVTPDGTTVVGQAFDMTTFELVPFVARFVDPCDLLVDGFESGATTAWSSTVP